MNLIILAAGAGSRLGNLTKNIPKCLVSFGGTPAIDTLLSVLPEADSITVCLSNDFRGELLKNYLSTKYCNVKFVVQKNPIGTANAVDLCLETDEDVLISWSDILPKNLVDIPTESSIFTTSDFLCRYRFDGTKIEKTDGNIIGLFFISREDVKIIKPMLSGELNADFVDILNKSGIIFNNVHIDCFDFGTESTLRETSNKLNTSAYADIEIDGCVVHKKYNDLSLFTKEATWYRFSPQSVKRFIPNIINIDDDNYSIDMEYIEPSSLRSESDMRDFLARVVYVLEEYFHSNKYPLHYESLIQEYIDEPIRRCELIYKLVPMLSNSKIIINYNEYDNPYELLHTHGKKIIDKLIPSNFSFIHGDPTMQNLILRGGEPVFIDPKAKFGNIWLYGDPKYDFAKLYYSFVGNYDGFNKGEYTLDINKDGFRYSIDKHRFWGLGDWYLTYLQRVLSIPIGSVKLLHAIIWLRLVGYILPRSFEQAIVAFLNASVLLNNSLEIV